MVSAHEPPYPTRTYAAYVIGVLFLVWFMAYLDRQILTLLLPSLKADLGVSDTQVSLIQGIAFASVYSVAGLPLGWIADRTNRRNLILVGLVFWSLATVACGLAQDIWQLAAARMAVGLGEACLAPASVSLMADYFRPAHRGRAMGVMQSGTPIGSAAALFLGGLLLTTLAHGGFQDLVPAGWAPWKVVFVAMGAPGLVVALLVATLREPVRRERAETIEGAGPSGLAAFIRQKYPALALLFAVYSCIFILGYGVSSWAPTVLMRIYGLEPHAAGALYGTMLLLCSGTASICSGLLSDRLVRRWPLGGRTMIPLILLPIDIIALVVFTFAPGVGVVIAALAVMTFTTNFSASSSYPALQDLVPNRLRGQVVAMLLLVGNLLGLGCGPTLVALITDRVFGDEMMLRMSVGIVGLSAASLAFLLALGLPRLYAAARRTQMHTPFPTEPQAAPLAVAAR
jgi:MFS family permease